MIGHFGFGHNMLNGQTVKTKILADELEKKIPGEVMMLDTHGGIKSLLKTPFYVWKALSQCENIVILPAQNGLRICAPVALRMVVFFPKRGLSAG